MMNRGKRRTLELNSIDVFIIAFIAICLLIIVFKTFNSSADDSIGDLKEYEIEFSVYNVRGSTVDYIVEGQIFKTKAEEKTLGTLLSKSAHALEYDEYNDSGEMIYYSKQDFSDTQGALRYAVKGTLSAVGEMTERGLVLESGVRILIGKELSVISELVEIKILITDINSQ